MPFCIFIVSSIMGFGWLAPDTSVQSNKATTQPVEKSLDELSAPELLERVAGVYAKCKTYKDTGEVMTVMSMPHGKNRERKEFKTAFIRPDRFRFEYKVAAGMMEGGRYIIWRDGESVNTWWDLRPGVQTPESLGLAIAGATGVSSAAAYRVPALLLPDEIKGRSPIGLTEPQRLKDGRLGSLECIRIRGERGGQTTIWIDKEMLLIRKIFEKRDIPNALVRTTTVYSPAIDEEVESNLLEFRPSAVNVEEESDEDDDE